MKNLQLCVPFKAAFSQVTKGKCPLKIDSGTQYTDDEQDLWLAEIFVVIIYLLRFHATFC